MKQKLVLLTLPLLAVGTFFLQGKANSADETGSKVRILKFEADWCGPCQQMKPVFDKVSKNLSGKAKFETINVDRQPGLAERYQVSGLPTVIAIKDGKVVGRSTGFMNQLRLKSFVQKNL